MALDGLLMDSSKVSWNPKWKVDMMLNGDIEQENAITVTINSMNSKMV